MPRASIFGGSWFNDDNAGSRYANIAYNWPDNSNDNIGARGRGDDWFPGILMCFPAARRRLRSRRPAMVSSWPIASLLFAVGEGLEQQWSARRSCFGEYISRSGRAGRSGGGLSQLLPSRPAAGFTSNFTMTKRYRNLIAKIVSPANMRKAYLLTARGKRMTAGYLAFKEFDAFNLDVLARDMADGSYAPGEPSEFYVLDPKRRLISALPFRDRVAQQALCLVIGEMFDRAMLPRAFACRPGKGTHAGVRLLQADMRHLTRRAGNRLYFLKTDFSRYFASIERAVLWRLIEAKISCAATLRLIEAIVPRGGIGIPIGSLTSQLFANLYCGATLDRYLQQTLGEDYWYRYMDDLVVLGESQDHLHRLKASIEEFSRYELGLRFSKWQVSSATRGVNFLGYRIWPTHKLLRKDSVIRARRKIAAFRSSEDDVGLTKFCASWLGHARFADCQNLIKGLGLMTGAPS